jgi:hypothetical protein
VAGPSWPSFHLPTPGVPVGPAQPPGNGFLQHLFLVSINFLLFLKKKQISNISDLEKRQHMKKFELKKFKF